MGVHTDRCARLLIKPPSIAAASHFRRPQHGRDFTRQDRSRHAGVLRAAEALGHGCLLRDRGLAALRAAEHRDKCSRRRGERCDRDDCRARGGLQHRADREPPVARLGGRSAPVRACFRCLRPRHGARVPRRGPRSHRRSTSRVTSAMFEAYLAAGARWLEVGGDAAAIDEITAPVLAA